MKITNIIYPALAGGLALTLAACQPDDYSMGGKNYSAASLANGSGFSVTTDGNKIHCSTSLSDCIGIWETSDGRYIGQSCDLFFPFAGRYFVLFGVMENGGITFASDTTWIDINTNSLESLNNDLWNNLTGGVGKSKKWVPMNMSYAPYHGSAPVMYLSPDDVLNNGSGNTDLTFGTGNWLENWDPGFQSWLIPADSPYMDSYMTFSLSEKDGATLEIFHGETSATENGKFSLNLDDKQHPTITFKGVQSLHNEGFNDVCANYSNDIKILELSPYIFQVATMRTNTEGPWWIVWNFVAEDVKNGTVEIPNDNVLQSAPANAPVLDDNLDKLIFTIEGDNGVYDANSVTYIFDEDKAYDLYWWDGSTGAWTERNVYGNPIYPNVDASDFALTFNKDANGVITFEEENSGAKGIAEFAGNKIKFMTAADENGNSYPIDLAFFASDGGAKATISASEITVVKASPADNKFFFAVENAKNEQNVTCQYLFANLVQKSIFGAPAGPLNIPVDNDKLNVYVEAGKYLRCEMYNPWNDKEWPIDPSKINLKNGQSITISFRLTGVDWTGNPKVALCHNLPDGVWEPACFDTDAAIDLNKDGVNTIKLTNTSGSKAKFQGSSCITIAIQYDGFATLPIDEELNVSIGNAKFEIVSFVIE